MQHASLRMPSGRTGAIFHSGKPQRRWHDGAVYAREYLQSARQTAVTASAARGRVEFDHIVQRQRRETIVTRLRLRGPGARQV